MGTNTVNPLVYSGYDISKSYTRYITNIDEDPNLLRLKYRLLWAYIPLINLTDEVRFLHRFPPTQRMRQEPSHPGSLIQVEGGKGHSVGTMAAMEESFRLSVIYYDISAKSQEQRQSLTAPIAMQNSRELQLVMDIWNMVNASLEGLLTISDNSSWGQTLWWYPTISLRQGAG